MHLHKSQSVKKLCQRARGCTNHEQGRSCPDTTKQQTQKNRADAEQHPPRPQVPRFSDPRTRLFFGGETVILRMVESVDHDVSKKQKWPITGARAACTAQQMQRTSSTCSGVLAAGSVKFCRLDLLDRATVGNDVRAVELGLTQLCETKL